MKTSHANYCGLHDMFRPCAWCAQDADDFREAFDRAKRERGAVSSALALGASVVLADGPAMVAENETLAAVTAADGECIAAVSAVSVY